MTVQNVTEKNISSPAHPASNQTAPSNASVWNFWNYFSGSNQAGSPTLLNKTIEPLSKDRIPQGYLQSTHLNRTQSGSQINLVPVNPIQKKEAQKPIFNLPSSDKLQVTLDRPFDISCGALEYGIPPYWNGNYWLSVVASPQSGLLRISSDSTKSPEFYPLSDDKNSFFILEPKLSTDTIAFIQAMDGNFSQWDFSLNPPRCLLEIERKSCHLFLSSKKHKYCHLIQYCKNSKKIELWDLKAQKITWTLDNWLLHEEEEESFAFGEFVPSRNLLLGIRQGNVYAVDIVQKKLGWSIPAAKNDVDINILPIVTKNSLVIFHAGKVTVHSLDDGSCLRSFIIESHNDRTDYILKIHEERLFFLKKEKIPKLTIWDLNTGQKINEFKLFEDAAATFFIMGNKIMGSNRAGYRKNEPQVYTIWEWETGKFLETLFFSTKETVQVTYLSNNILAFASLENFEPRRNFDALFKLNKKEFPTYKGLWNEKLLDPPKPGKNLFKLTFLNLNDCNKLGETVEDLALLLGMEPVECFVKDQHLIVGGVTEEGQAKLAIKKYDLDAFTDPTYKDFNFIV